MPVPPEAPQRHQVAGRDFACLVCKDDRFWSRRALLNTAGMTFFGLDWANRDALVLVCAACGHVHWFAD